MSKLRRPLLAGGLALFLLTLGLALFANYRAPRLATRLVWTGGAWTATEAAPPLQKGDRLLKLGATNLDQHSLLVDCGLLNDSPEFWRWLDHNADLYHELSTSQVPTVVIRGSAEIRLLLPVTRNSWTFLRDPQVVTLFVGAVYFLIGWAAFLRSKGDKLTGCFYLFCLTMGVGFEAAGASLLANPVLQPSLFRALNIFYFVNFVLSPAQMAHFALLLPRDRSRPWHLVALYGPSLGALLSFQVGLFVPLVGLNYLLALAIMMWSAWTCKGLVERQQMKWVGAGFSLGMTPGLLLNALPLLLGGERLVSDTVPGTFQIFVPLCMAVAIARYRLFDIGALMQGTLVYLGAVLILVCLDVALLSGLGLSQSPGSIGVLAGVLALYGPVRGWMAGALLRLAGGRRLRGEEALALLSGHLREAGGGEVLACLRATVHRLYAPEFLLEEGSPGGGEEVGARVCLGETPTVLLVLSAEQALRCGPLPEGKFYTSEDLAVLEHLTRHAALHLETAALLQRAVQERSQRLAEREKILGDLHDGVGSALAAIRLGSQEPRTAQLAADALFELQHFLYNDAEHSLPFEEFVAEIRGYARNLVSGQNVELTVRAQGDMTAPLGRSLALDLFRLVKEALNNALKHSGASTITVALDLTPDPSPRVRVQVKDDGRGLRPEDGNGRGLSGMRRRVEERGGRFELHSDDGGLTLQMEVPPKLSVLHLDTTVSKWSTKPCPRPTAD